MEFVWLVVGGVVLFVTMLKDAFITKANEADKDGNPFRRKKDV